MQYLCDLIFFSITTNDKIQMWMTTVKRFQIAKISKQDIAWILLNVLLISVPSYFKSVAYVKKRVQKNEKERG